ncbi:hypothetical protein APSETT444_007997 [Aspergillus pseudonomiae]
MTWYFGKDIFKNTLSLDLSEQITITADFGGQVIIVTGGTSGMGLATSSTLARQGARIAIWDINYNRVMEVTRDLNSTYADKVMGQVIDITDRYAVKTALVETQLHFGAVHAIANFAGTGGGQLGVESIWETKQEEFDFIITLNVKGLFNIVGEALALGFLRG